MKLLDAMLSWRPPSIRSAVYPVHSAVYQLAASVYFVILFIVQIFRLLNNFRLIVAEVSLTIRDVIRSVREAYMLLTNILAPLEIVGRFLIVITEATHNISRRTVKCY